MSTLGDIIRAALAELEPDERQAVGGVVLRVAWEPAAEDVARGCGPGWRGYFYGSAPSPGARGDGGRNMLPAHDEPPEADGPAPAVGEIAIFLGNIRPLTALRLRLVVRHELSHALGYDEEDAIEQGHCFEEELAPELDKEVA